MMQIPDPIHGYIDLDGLFAHIVNTPEFQRLRSVEQGSFRPVYPGARHDRFSHSLGTYHLATIFAEYFFLNLEKDAGIKVKKEERERLSMTFRYAALLHDVGHAPFSHTTEGFFLEKKDPDGTPVVWRELCEEAKTLSGELFPKKKVGSAHEIVSALLLIRSRDVFLTHKDGRMVDPVLAARMVIGLTYQPGELPGVSDELLGVRNCLIQLLNCSVLDVDRLDYMLRDAKMSGYVNAPLDLNCLARSVTAVREKEMLVPAYREDALRVFDLMFQAKLSHDTWVLSVPAGAYDAALLAHCIRMLDEKIKDEDPGKTYMNTIFTAQALTREGVEFAGKHYRLLNDVDVAADLKAQDGEIFEELYTRELGGRRIAAWRSYYEFNHIFNWPEKHLTPEKVCEFFDPLLKFMESKGIFVFDRDAYARIEAEGDAGVLRAAALLRKFLMGAHSKKKVDEDYSVVLLGRSNSFTLKLKPDQIRIVFPNREDGKKRLPLRGGICNYSTYAQLTCGTGKVDAKAGYFYIMRHGGLGAQQLEKLRRMLAKELKP